jgi:hypothetical protein
MPRMRSMTSNVWQTMSPALWRRTQRRHLCENLPPRSVSSPRISPITCVDYGERFHAGKCISTGFVESAVNQIVDKRQSTRRTPRGTHLLLQTRARVFNGDLDQLIRRRYPALRKPTRNDLAHVSRWAPFGDHADQRLYQISTATLPHKPDDRDSCYGINSCAGRLAHVTGMRRVAMNCHKASNPDIATRLLPPPAGCELAIALMLLIAGMASARLSAIQAATHRVWKTRFSKSVGISITSPGCRDEH